MSVVQIKYALQPNIFCCLLTILIRIKQMLKKIISWWKKLGCVCVCSVTGTCVTFGHKLELHYEIMINVKRQRSSSSEVSGNYYIQNTQNTSKLIKKKLTTLTMHTQRLNVFHKVLCQDRGKISSFSTDITTLFHL